MRKSSSSSYIKSSRSPFLESQPQAPCVSNLDTSVIQNIGPWCFPLTKDNTTKAYTHKMADIQNLAGTLSLPFAQYKHTQAKILVMGKNACVPGSG